MPDEDGNEEVVNNEVVEETTALESTPDADNSPDVDEPETVQADDGELHLPESEGDEVSDAEDEEGDKPQTRADKRKEQLKSEIEELEQKVEKPEDPNTEIRDMVARRNELRQAVEQRNAEVYKPANVDELLEQVNPETGDYFTRSEAKIAALEQKLELKEYNSHVAEAQIAIESDVRRVFNEFPMFNPQSAEYNAEVAQEVGQLLERTIQTDPNTGDVIGSSIPIYQLYRTHALASQSSARNAKIQGQKATEKMLSHADTVTGGQGAKKTFSQMSLKDKEAFLRKKGHDV